jgi:hypothetical protein
MGSLTLTAASFILTLIVAYVAAMVLLILRG